MRFNLNLKLTDRRNNILPINYQYELSSWIYKTINTGDPAFANWLHKEGYTVKQKHFKMFTFSNLNIPMRSILKDRLIIHSEEITVTISFIPIKSAQGFIEGLFRNRDFSLGDKQSQVQFHVEDIEALPEPKFSDLMTFRSTSPILISVKKPEERYAQYLSPDAEGYSQLLLENLKSKHYAFTNTLIPEENIKFKIFTEPKRKGINIKSGTTAESKLIAYNYSFSIEVNPTLLRLGYYCGFGEKNSMGFGCVETAREMM